MDTDHIVPLLKLPAVPSRDPQSLTGAPHLPFPPPPGPPSAGWHTAPAPLVFVVLTRTMPVFLLGPLLFFFFLGGINFAKTGVKIRKPEITFILANVGSLDK